MKLNVTWAEADALRAEALACDVAPGRFDGERWARWLWQKFGIPPHLPVEYQLVVRHDVLAIPCVGVERVEP